VGVAPATALSRSPKGHQPQDFLPSVKSMVSMAMKMNRTAILNLPKTLREYKMLYETTNAKLNSAATKIAQFLEEQGYEAIPIPASSPYDRQKITGDISHKHAAVRAGLGKFGINNLILTPKYGPYVRFVTILTNAPLKPDKLLEKDPCLGDECMQCVKICPIGALDNPKHNPEKGWSMDKKKCYQYIHGVLGGEVCGLCIKACPIGSKTYHRQKPKT
jgi:epoxyqueuosine reductase